MFSKVIRLRVLGALTLIKHTGGPRSSTYLLLVSQPLFIYNRYLLICLRLSGVSMQVSCQERHEVREPGTLWCGGWILDAWLLCAGDGRSLCVPSAGNLPGVRPQRMASEVWRDNRLPHPLPPGASTLVRRPDVSGELGVPFQYLLDSFTKAFCLLLPHRSF